MRLTLVAIFCLLAGCAAPSFMRGDGTAMRIEDASPQAQEVIMQAIAQIGVPYRYGGASPATGFDCSGLVQYAFGRGAGVPLPRTTYDISQAGQQIGRRDLQPGDLVFFDTQRRPYSHVGIYLGNQRFIHAPSTGGKVEIVSMTNRYWENRFNGARRIGL